MNQPDNQICVFDEDEYGQHICTVNEFLTHVNNLPQSEKPLEYIPVGALRWAVELTVTQDWDDDPIGDHLERIKNADLSYPITIHGKNIADGVHRIVKADILGVEELPVIRVKSLPPLRYHLNAPYGDVVKHYGHIADELNK